MDDNDLQEVLGEPTTDPSLLIANLRSGQCEIPWPGTRMAIAVVGYYLGKSRLLICHVRHQ